MTTVATRKAVQHLGLERVERPDADGTDAGSREAEEGQGTGSATAAVQPSSHGEGVVVHSPSDGGAE